MNKKRISEGFIYIISNPSFPNFYKVGVTIDIQSRLKTYQTADPKRSYHIEHYIFHSNCYEMEKKINELFRPFALSIRNEWYEINKSMAISILDDQVEKLK